MEKDDEDLVIRNDDDTIAINYNELLKKVDKNWSDLEKTRFLYIELGKFFIYDSNFVLAKDKSMREQIGAKGIADIKNNKIVCMSIARIYTELLKRCGIQAETILIPPDENDSKDVGHAYTQVTVDGRKGSVGLIHDLTNIKVGFKTQDFLEPIGEEKVEKFKEKLRNDGFSEEEINNEIKNRRKEILEIPKNELKEIDKKIGYTNENGMYFDDILNETKKYFESMRKDFKYSLISDERWLAYQINFIIENIGHDSLTCIEKKDYFEKAIEQCISQDSLDKFNRKAITCFDKNGKMKVFHIFEQQEREGVSKRLVYSLTDKEILPVTQNEINLELKDGLTIFSQKHQDEYYNILTNNKLENKQQNVLQGRENTEKGEPSKLGDMIRKVASEDDVKKVMEEAGKRFQEHKQKIKEGCDWVHDIR